MIDIPRTADDYADDNADEDMDDPNERLPGGSMRDLSIRYKLIPPQSTTTAKNDSARHGTLRLRG